MVFRLLAFFALYVQILFGVWMFSSRIERREKGAARQATILVGYAILAAIIIRLTLLPPQGTTLPGQLLLFTAFLWACVGLVLAGRKATLATALFCATAGYTTQNLASGLDGLVKLLALTWFGVEEYVPALFIPSFAICTLAVYVPVYLLFVRNMRDTAPELRGHRVMYAMVLVTMLVVILFDVVNKALPLFGVPLGVVCVTRLVHGVVCVFVLYAEYEMLFNQRLRTQVAVTERVLEERGSQYELSRETIAAVNRRIHDMRHQLSRELDAAQVGGERIADVVRVMEVYDASVRTGNEALDTALTERRLICGREGVTLTCIADGTCLAHLSPAETYSLVGSLVDEAMAAALTVDDPGMRTVSLSVRPVGGMACVHVETFVGRDWLRTDEDGAAEQVARANDGLFSALVEDDVLTLDVALPIPECVEWTGRSTHVE